MSNYIPFNKLRPIHIQIRSVIIYTKRKQKFHYYSLQQLSLNLLPKWEQPIYKYSRVFQLTIDNVRLQNSKPQRITQIFAKASMRKKEKKIDHTICISIECYANIYCSF